ncbi:gp53-like domain-containing protein [Pseudoxanthomonas winnipegensis]|uniref:gp53-like domain-containing protein n=1 Tax=Pseudoxanthomonas winnipegensis TaxID=2480810 RepID=UPI00103A0550|nr:hypothetical protein [Pseudoxanthomonas winnipegensis]TBV76889.1 hypothetical protein EYC45_01605 [Pseudoxanthomonas winnipegensis]
MHRIDTSTATADHKFTEGNPQSGVAPTVVSADILNAFQEELAHVVEQSGQALNKADNTQLWQALASLAISMATTTEAGKVELATVQEAITGTDTVRAVTPEGLAGGVQAVMATNSEVAAGTSTKKAVTPAGLASLLSFGANYVRLGNFILQWGSGSIPSSGAHGASLPVTFPTAMATCLHVSPVGTKAAISAAGVAGVFTPSGISGTGFTCNVNTNVDDTNSQWNMNQAATFTWFAIGTVAQ